VTEQQLALAINGRESRLVERLRAFDGVHDGQANGHQREGSVAVVGLGYVGLPTAYALCSQSSRTIGVDASPQRLSAIAKAQVDLPAPDREGLLAALDEQSLALTADSAALATADAVILCVPTPVDGDREPDLGALRAACSDVLTNVHSGQTIILTSTTFPGTTRQLLVEPLQERGWTVGEDVFVAFSPERIDPGNLDHVQRETPRIVGGETAACSARAARVIGRMTDQVYLVSSPEAAELTKLYENVFRAVNLALANEVADVCGGLGLDPIEVTVAAGTKPYGFLGSFPGPGVGGHCIPCDPHYLLWRLHQQDQRAPLIEQAMRGIENRPAQVARRALAVLAGGGADPSGARVLLAGVSYKAGVSDLRESPALAIMSTLEEAGVEVAYHDPLLPAIELASGKRLLSQADPDGADWDLVLVHTVHPGHGYEWVRRCPRVLDATYQFDSAEHRELV
jgi:nucleotide sugar dehydrogenase